MTGAAYVYDVSTGQELRKLMADALGSTTLGHSVALSGNLALVGSTWDLTASCNAGGAFLFEVNSGAQLLKLNPSCDHHPDLCGWSCALSGAKAIVGDPWLGSSHRGGAFVFDTMGSRPADAFCFGDLGSGACPCGNDNDGSIPGSGCDNGVFSSGAKLHAYGTARVGEDTLVLALSHAEPNNVCLFFQGDRALSPGVAWGNGLRCVNGNLRRLAVRIVDELGSSNTSPGIAVGAGNVSAGAVKHYQCMYRTNADPLCGPGTPKFNTTNGLTIGWSP